MSVETKRPISLRSDTVKVGSRYSFEIYKNGGATVVSGIATVMEKPEHHIRDYGSEDAVVVQIEGESEPRRLVRGKHHPYFLVTRVDNKRNCRVRFREEIVPTVTDEVTETQESELAEA
ncbi:MAG: hypothetical protein [Caudoviricetes sp.]|nr:MAG: hypothetical protein [Caudoviricetes sp.]